MKSDEPERRRKDLAEKGVDVGDSRGAKLRDPISRGLRM